MAKLVLIMASGSFVYSICLPQLIADHVINLRSQTRRLLYKLDVLKI